MLKGAGAVLGNRRGRFVLPGLLSVGIALLSTAVPLTAFASTPATLPSASVVPVAAVTVSAGQTVANPTLQPAAVTVTASPKTTLPTETPAPSGTPVPAATPVSTFKATATPKATATSKPTATPKPTPTVTPTPAPYVYREGEIVQLQDILNYSHYLLPNLSAKEAETGKLDAATREAIRQYLATLNADPAWTRDYLTSKEFKQLLAFLNTNPPMQTVPTPRLAAAATLAPSLAPTPEPREIVIISPTLPPNEQILLIPQPLTEGFIVQGKAEPERGVTLSLGVTASSAVNHVAKTDAEGMFSARFSADECAALDGVQGVQLTAVYADVPGMPSAGFSILYQTTRVGDARLISFSFSRRNTELRIRGQVSSAGIPVTLQSAEGVTMDSVTAAGDGQFDFRLSNAMNGDRPIAAQYRLILNNDDLRPETLPVSDVKQETLIPFTRLLQTPEVALIAGGLLLLGLGLLFACCISRKRATRRKKGQGGDPRG